MNPWLANHLLSTLSFLLTLVFVSFILRSRRPAGSAWAWLIIIVAVPYVGIPLYLFFSGRKFGSRLAQKQKISRPLSQSRPLKDLSSTQRILYASGVSEAKSNLKMDLLPTGVQAYDELIGRIRGARKSIHVTTFIFGNDDVGRAVVGELTQKAAAGISVKVLVDSLGATLIRHPSFSELKRVGGEIAYFMPFFHVPFRGRTNLRNHRKLMVVDGESAVLGGMNLAKEYLGPTDDPRRWIDLAVEIKGGCVDDLQEIFLQDWAYATRTRRPTGSAIPPERDDKFLAQVVASGPDVLGDPLYDVLLSSIHESKKCVRIVTPYFIPDESLTKALELAVKRGVEVHVIIPRRSNHRLADLARGSFVTQLENAGAHFGLYPRMIHAKVLLIDDSLAILGSANFDMRSLMLNYELGLAVYSKDVLADVERWVLERQRETGPGAPSSGFWRELGEGIGRVIGPIL